MEWHSPDFVVTNQVDIGVNSLCMEGEFFGVFGTIIDAPEQDVFQSDFSTGSCEPLVARIEQFIDRAEFCPGNDLASERIVRRVKAEGECDGDLEIAELSYRCGKANGRNRDPSRADAEAPRRIERANRVRNGGVIGEGLAHTHEDDMRNAIDTLKPTELVDLLKDLASRQVAFESADSRGAKLASNGTSKLTRDARGSARVGGNHDAFRLRPSCDLRLRGALPQNGENGLLIAKSGPKCPPSDQKLLSAIARGLVRNGPSAGERKLLREQDAIALRQIAHLRRIDRAFAIDPVEDLIANVTWHSIRCRPRAKALSIEVEEVFGCSLNRGERKRTISGTVLAVGRGQF